MRIKKTTLLSLAALVALLLTTTVLSQIRRDRGENFPIGGEDSFIVDSLDEALSRVEQIESKPNRVLLWFGWMQYPHAMDPMGVRLLKVGATIERINTDEWRVRFEISGECWWPYDWALGKNKPDFSMPPPWRR